MDPRPPIPTPLEQRWREFRIQVLPVVFFLGVVAALAFVWRYYIQPVSVVGEVEAIKANAASHLDGTIVELAVDRFDHVTNGQVLGKVQTTDPALLAASLAALAADLKIVKVQVDLDRTRNLDAFARMKLDLLTERVALNLARIRLVQAEKEFERMQKLYDLGVVPAGVAPGVAPQRRDIVGYDVTLRDRDALRAEVEDRTKLIAEWEKQLQQMESVGQVNAPGQDSLVNEVIQAKEQQLQQTMAPVFLVAPIDGMVSTVWRRLGERIVRGEPILTISAPVGDHIVGYMRQPFDRIPTVQDTVEVQTRGLRRVKGEGRVLQVGAQVEPINPALISTDANRLELGLPILISMPPSLRDSLRPGQVVDLFIRFSKSDKS
jgi:multidrug resistance efflux pump